MTDSLFEDLTLTIDIQALSDMRDQLGDYLATMERNTDAVKEWLSINKDSIILSHQKLERALNNKEEAKAISLVSEMGAIAGFVLSLQDFKAKAETAFGKDSAFQKAIAGIEPGLPATLQEPLPALTLPKAELLPGLLENNIPVPEEEKEGWLGSWFNQEEKQKKAQTRKFLQELHEVKTEMLALETERHYYIDDVMDFLADTLAPETFDADGKPVNTEAKMLGYKNPTHAISIAQADYNKVVQDKARIIKEAALGYSRTANTIDREDASGILKEFEALFAGTVTEAATLLKKNLLEDYQSLSLNELILKHIKSRSKQAQLLSFSLTTLQEPLSFADAKTPAEIFEKFVLLALDKAQPLPPAALAGVITALKSQRKMTYTDMAFSDASKTDGKNIFQRVTERFADDLSAQEAVLDALLTGMDSPNAGIAKLYVRFCENLRQKNVGAISEDLKKIEDSHMAMEIGSLWHLCHEDVSLMETIHNISKSPEVKGALLASSLQAGLLGELRINGDDGYGYKSDAGTKFQALIEEDVLTALDTFPLDTARLLIAHGFSLGGLNQLSAHLTSSGWLKKIVSSNISDQKKAEWVSAFLEPFPAAVVRANILAQAARGVIGKPSDLLSSMEKNMIGENIPLTEDKILCNLSHIANIWYNAESKSLHYTVQGQSHPLLEDVSLEAADEILALIQRRGGFMQEQHGLFNPDRIDTIEHNIAQGETKVAWYRVTSSLNIDAATVSQLIKHPSFLHVTDPATGNVDSYNLASICLLQKQEDGSSLMIDKYGRKHILDGRISMQEDARLIDIDGATKFNPENAALIRMNVEDNNFEFRIESADFDKLLNPHADEFFYTVPVKNKAALTSLQNQMNKMPDIHAPNQADLSDLYFNMKTLGYLALTEKASGLYCQRHSPTHKPGLIMVDPEMAEAILSGIAKKPGMTRIGDLLIHDASIDDAYYNARKQRLQFIVGHEVQEVNASASEGYGLLAGLARNKQFKAISSEEGIISYTDPQVRPTDVVHIDNVTFLARTPGQDKTFMITENLPFPINLNDADTQSCFKDIEQTGLEAARKSAKADAWTQNVDSVLSRLPKLRVSVSPFISLETPEILLQQLLGKANANAPKKLKKEFATVASLPESSMTFDYPERKKEARQQFKMGFC